MRESYLLERMDVTRSRLVQVAEKCPESKRNTVPQGFNNSIHWQIGHVFTITERLIFTLIGATPQLSADYQSFFGSGTRPADWQVAPPSWDSLMVQLKEQPLRIREALSGKLDTLVNENFLKAETIDEVLIGSLMHESNHAGTMSAMLKLLNDYH